jgi:hypothetical protein
MAAANIFLSYANVDRPRVEVLVKTLESQGLDLWWDRDIPRGKNFNRVIEDALQQAKCAIVIWSRASVDSEWVFNEASAARKRGMLVPVLIDDIEPPLEFRHLQAARLVGWQGDVADAEFIGLLDAVRGLAQQSGNAPTVHATASTASAQRWWQTPAGMAIGLGGLLAGLAILLIALKQVGLLGGAASTQSTPPPVVSSRPVVSSPPVAQAPVTSPSQSAPQSAPTVPSPPAPTGAGSGKTTGEATHANLIDPAEGGKLVIANEDAWRRVMESKLTSAIIGTHGFAVFAFRDEKPALIDTVGVFVEATSTSNMKDLAVYASDQSETGPFRKIVVLTVPNYRNMRTPVHEFKVDPFTARYVKVQIMSWQGGDGLPNGYVGNIQLFGTLR